MADAWKIVNHAASHLAYLLHRMPALLEVLLRNLAEPIHTHTGCQQRLTA